MTYIALLPALLLAACVTRPPPDPAPDPDVEAVGREVRDDFCTPGSLLRTCIKVPNATTCEAVFADVWPACRVGIHPSEDRDRNYAEGRVAGRCVFDAFSAKFGVTGDPACLDIALEMRDAGSR